MKVEVKAVKSKRKSFNQAKKISILALQGK